MKRLLWITLIFFASPLADAQGVRYDIPPILNSRGGPVANASISLCPGTATISSGSSTKTCSPANAQSYADISLATQCPAGSPVTLAASSICQSTGDAAGNAGFWLAPGTYIYCINAPALMQGYCTTLTVPGPFYVTAGQSLQAAITAACNATPAGGTIFLAPGTYALGGTPVTWCNGVNISGSGQCQADVQTCPTTITTTITSGCAFPFTNINDSSIANFAIKNVGSGGGQAYCYTSAQRNRATNIYISGPFAGGYSLNSSSTALASTIWNTDDNIHCTGLQANAWGIKFDSADATTKVINNNNVWQDHCTGGTGGKALWFTNTNQAQVINENIINCTECSATNGTAIQFDQGTTADTVLLAVNAEGSTTGFNKTTGNVVTFVGGNISSNGTNVTDAQPAFTIFLGTRVGGVIPQFSVTPAGNLDINCLGINASCSSNTINVVAGAQMTVAGGALAALNATSFQLSQALILNDQPAPTTAGGVAVLYSDSTSHTAKLSNNNGSFFNVTQTIVSGTATLGVGAISSNSCAAAVTVSATGVATTDAISWSFNADPNTVTGYGAGATGTLSIWSFPTPNNVNFRVCNLTAGSITPGAATLNWRVTR